MWMAMTTERLPCAECGYQNEPERVYCHNCGAKLDRSLLIAAKKSKESKKALKKPRSLLEKKVRKPVLRPLLSSVAVAAVLAATILVFLPPENAPTFDKEPMMQLPEIGGALSELSALDRRVAASYTEQQINAYIKSTIRSKDKGGLSDYVKYVGSAVDIRKGTCTVTMVQSLFGYPLYSHMTFEPSGQPGNLKAKVVTCGIGRLDLPAGAAPAMHLIFRRLWKAANNEIEAMSKLGQISLADDMATFISRDQPAL